MINVADINEYLKSIKSSYKIWSYNYISKRTGDFVIIDKFGDAVIHLYRDTNTGKILTSTWNKDYPDFYLFTYETIVTIKYHKEDIYRVFLVRGLRNGI